MSMEASHYSELKSRLLQLEEEITNLRQQLEPEREKFQLPAQATSFLTLMAGEQKFALYLFAINEVIRMVKLTPLSGAPTTIAGLLNLRGQIMPVLDLRSLLGCVAKPYTRNTPIIIFEYENKRRALITDAIADVITLTPTELESPLGVIPNIEYILALIRHPQGLITLLDHTRLLSFEQEHYLEAALHASEIG